MSKACDLLPLIKLLASAEEAVGKTVSGVSAGVFDRTFLLVFTDETALYLDIADASEGFQPGEAIEVSTEIAADEFAVLLADAGVITKEISRWIVAEYDEELRLAAKIRATERRAEEQAEQDQRERAEYERLKAKFGGEG